MLLRFVWGHRSCSPAALHIFSSHFLPPCCTSCVWCPGGCKCHGTLCICTWLVLRNLDGVRTSGSDFKKEIFLGHQVHVGSQHSAALHLSPSGFTYAHKPCQKWELGEGELPLHNFLRFVNTVFLFGHEWVINQTIAGLWGLVPFFSKWIG